MRSWFLVTLSCVLCSSFPARAQEDSDGLRRQLERVIEQNEALRHRVDSLESEVRQARDEAAAARRLAEQPPTSSASAGGDALLTAPVGSTGRLQLLDVSLDVLSSVGGSSASDETLAWLQAGGHDPRRRGFNLQAVELSLQGAVDPWLDGEVHLLYFVDPEGESRFELEEAFATTRALPWELERRGLQLKLGQFYTDFGRINPQHPHAWDWQDQPVVLSRFFGPDGMRGVGTEARWLAPVDWFSEVVLGVQNAQGETMVSFLSSDEAFEEAPVGGRPFASNGTRSLDDLVYLARWANGFDLSDTWSAKLGVSGLYGPNATGSDGYTVVYGADAVLKWRPLSTERGWPFLVLQGEVLGRRYEADSFAGCLEEDCDETLVLPGERLDDWGFYAQALWGFRRGWAAGLRYEYATGSGGIDRPADPLRDDRHRLSPLLAFYPSEFSRIRLQYNLDRADFTDGFDHTVWLGLEFLFGQHPAHTF